jgi:phosphate/sulfate permease
MVISAAYVRRLKKAYAPIRTQALYNPEIATSLDKAKKHLQQARSATSGELNYHLSSLIEEISGFSHSLKQTKTGDEIDSEYAAVEKIFAYLQIVSACLMAFAHGANDVANAIGPLSAAIHVLTSGVISETTQVPAWALGLGGIGIVAGLATWGWRVIETVGKKITELTPTRGFAAEFAAAMTIVAASQMGMPISTTHTLVGAVIGVGFARGIEALNLSTMRDIIISWIVTVPVGAALGIVFCYILKGLF